MADKEQKNVTRMEFWLNPSVEENGIYQIHINYQYDHRIWKYSQIAPTSLPIAQKSVYAPAFLTEEDKREVDPQQEIKQLEEQIDNLKQGREKESKRSVEDVEQTNRDVKNGKLKTQLDKTLARYDDQIKEIGKQIGLLEDNSMRIKNEIERLKTKKSFYCFIGNSDPVAKGITAFFIKKGLHDYSPTSSLLDMLKREEEISIQLWYEEYYENQIEPVRRINNGKTKAQGRLSNTQLTDDFNIMHLESEKMFYSESEDFFSITQREDEQSINILREYVEGYIHWVSEQIKATTVQFPSIFSETKLHAIAERLVSMRLIRNGEKPKFVSLFTPNPASITWNDNRRGAKPALFNLMDRITEQKTQAKNLKPFVKTESGKPIYDNWASRYRSPSTIVDKILHGI